MRTASRNTMPSGTSARRTWPYASRPTAVEGLNDVVLDAVRRSLRRRRRRRAARPSRAALDDRADDRVDDRSRGRRSSGNSSGITASVAPAALHIPSASEPDFAAHAHDEVPARGGARVFHQALDDVGADRARGFEAERRRVVGQRKIVVDRLGDGRDADAPVRSLGDPRRAVGRVVAADADQIAHAERVSERTQRSSVASSLAGFVREVRRIEPPVEWMRETSSSVSSTVFGVSPARDRGSRRRARSRAGRC